MININDRNGKKQVSFYWTHPITGERDRFRKNAPASCTTKRKAHQWAMAQLERLEDPDTYKPSAMTFREFAVKYLEHAPSFLKPSTVKMRTYRIEANLVPFFGDMRLDEIRGLQVDEYLAARMEDGIKSTTLRGEIAVLSSMLGQAGRVVFASATVTFLVLSICVIASAFIGTPAPPTTGHGAVGQTPFVVGAGLGPVLLAIPLGMALATGVEAPSNAIAQVPQLHDRGRRRLGRLTLWAMVGIVGALTIAFTVLTVYLGTGLPPADSTLIAEVARQATGGGPLFVAFQASSALLLLSAAASSYLAGSGVLKALATVGKDGPGLVPSRFGRVNRFLIPEWGVGLVLVAAAILVAAGGREQTLVGFYAVAVFASFLAATIACARLSYRQGRRVTLAFNVVAAVLVATILAINATRLDGMIALVAAAAVAAYLWRTWVRRGRPRGVATAGAG